MMENGSTLKRDTAFVLACVGLMLVGFALAAFSAGYVFKYSNGFFTPLISLAVPGAFLIYAFFAKFSLIERNWNELLVFTAGSYALCLSPLIIIHILGFIQKLLGI